MRLWESLKWILGEGCDEGLDLEYHDATDDPGVLEPVEPMQKSVLSHGGCGSSSLRECIGLLNNTERNAPATLHSRVKMENASDPLQNPHFGVPFSYAINVNTRHEKNTLKIQISDKNPIDKFHTLNLSNSQR